MNPPPPITRRITEADASKQFSCGNAALDSYFADDAFQHDVAGMNRAYVLLQSDVDAADLPPVVGFYTLSMMHVGLPAIDAIVGQMLSRVPPYPKPAALIGRFAVDTRAQRRGFGEKLLFDALGRAFTASTLVGCLGVVVDAKDASVAAFYARYDFQQVSASRRMFLSIATLRDLLELDGDV
jgi:ribosomal protein S18 acetylase RimI-like enzyme